MFGSLGRAEHSDTGKMVNEEKKMKLKRKKMELLICWMICVLPVLPRTSWCADAENDKSVKLDSITATANKMEENIKDVPQGITVIDEYVLEEKGIKNAADVINEIPNMALSPDHGNAVNFRGLNTSMFTSNNPVVIYIDGVPLSDRYGFDASWPTWKASRCCEAPRARFTARTPSAGSSIS